MEVASRTPLLVAGLARSAAVGGPIIACSSLEMLSKLCLYSSQGYCLALQVPSWLERSQLHALPTLSSLHIASCQHFRSLVA